MSAIDTFAYISVSLCDSIVKLLLSNASIQVEQHQHWFNSSGLGGGNRGDSGSDVVKFV